MRTGRVPLPLITSRRPQLAELADNLPQARDAPRSSFLLPPVRKLEDTIYGQAQLRKSQAQSLSGGLDLLSALSGGSGPRRFLIAIANAAEMRGTGGMVLAYGEVTSLGGLL